MYNYSRSKREKERKQALAAVSFAGFVVVTASFVAALFHMDAFDEGRRDHERGRPAGANPYTGRSAPRAEYWDDGWVSRSRYP